MSAFSTKSELKTWLRNNGYSEMSNGTWYPTGTYYLSHGEYSQPEYSPRRYKDGWSLHATYFYYAGKLYAPEDGRVLPSFFWGQQ